jgi:hypothetical protein
MRLSKRRMKKKERGEKRRRKSRWSKRFRIS